MTLSVSDEALKETTNCTNHFQCLSGRVHLLCEVEYLEYLDRLVCKDRRTEEACVYRVNGYGSACTCPVRNELFIKYGI